MATDGCWLILCFLVGLTWLVGRWQRRHLPGGAAAVLLAGGWRQAGQSTGERGRKRRWTVAAPPRPSPVPWREIKRRRGAPKRIATEGYACPRPTTAVSPRAPEARPRSPAARAPTDGRPAANHPWHKAWSMRQQRKEACTA